MGKTLTIPAAERGYCSAGCPLYLGCLFADRKLGGETPPFFCPGPDCPKAGTYALTLAHTLSELFVACHEVVVRLNANKPIEPGTLLHSTLCDTLERAETNR